MFDKKQKNYVKHIHLITDDGLHDRKAFYKVEKYFLFTVHEWWRNYQV